MFPYEDFKDKSGIYIIKNKVNNKVYIGKTKKFSRRFFEHTKALNKGDLQQENEHFINAWNKYGEENFEFIIYEVISMNLFNFEELIRNREYFWIIYFKSLNKNFGYNKRADSTSKVIIHEDTKQKFREIFKGEGNPNYGNKWSKEAKLRMSKIIKNQYESGSRIINPDSYKKGYESKLKLWKEKLELKELMGKRVSEKTSKFNIVQFDKDLNIIKEWTQYDLRKSGEYYLPNILQLCNGTKKGWYKNYIWRYKNKLTGEIIFQEIPKIRDFTVLKIDKFTNEILAIYKDAREAAMENDIKTVSNISKMCKKKEVWQKYPYFFRYKPEYYEL